MVSGWESRRKSLKSYEPFFAGWERQALDSAGTVTPAPGNHLSLRESEAASSSRAGYHGPSAVAQRQLSFYHEHQRDACPWDENAPNVSHATWYVVSAE
jgi:hypothetical protein